MFLSAGSIDKTLDIEDNFMSSPLNVYTAWPNRNASILFGIIFQKLINKNEKLFHNNNK